MIAVSHDLKKCRKIEVVRHFVPFQRLIPVSRFHMCDVLCDWWAWRPVEVCVDGTLKAVRPSLWPYNAYTTDRILFVGMFRLFPHCFG